MSNKLSYGIIFFVFIGIFFSLKINAQEKTALDTIVISPRLDYTTEKDSAMVPMEETSLADEDTVNYADTLVSKFRPIPTDTIQKLNKDKGFYYKDYFDSLLRARQKMLTDEPKKTKRTGDSFLSLLFRLLIWVGAISVFVFLVYKLFLSNSSLFSGNRRNTTGEKISVDIENPDDPASLVDDAVRQANYRLAVRYLFLQTLKNLADKKYIQTGSEKTNYQYVNELSGHPLVNEFASLTLKYEYVWYGEYPLDIDLYDQIYNGFKNFNKNIGR